MITSGFRAENPHFDAVAPPTAHVTSKEERR